MIRFVLACALCFAVESVWAARADSLRRVEESSEPTPLDIIRLEGGYVFESELSDSDNDLEFGEQDAFEIEFEYGHRFHLTGKWYLRAGIYYNRFDFNSDDGAPVPDHLQSVAAVISIDYMVGEDRGAFLEFQPGFYAEDRFANDTFDVPMTLARAWVLRPDSLYLFTGLNVAFLRGQLPVLPLVGVVWKISDHWVLYGVAPKPRLIYMPNKKFHLWIGGQLTGGSFRTDKDPDIVPAKLSNAQIDYSDYRAGVGFVWNLSDAIEIDFGGGYSVLRRFNFERAGEDFTTEPAPYLRLSVKAAL
jgi:hypothetical protein